MISDKQHLCIGMALLCVLCTPLTARPELSQKDQDAANRMIAGTLYLRLDVPLKSVQGVWGIGPKAVLVVSPTGHDTARRLALPMNSKKERMNWEFFPNYAVRYGKLTFAEDFVDVSIEGVKPHNEEIAILFIDIETLDDFIKAFNQTFSRVPLQDEHPEWPAEVRKAIAVHKVVVGMTKEQAFDVVGTPLDIKTEIVNGVEVETWHPRQDMGQSLREWSDTGDELGATGFPVLLKFVSGKLQVIE